jgi:hypothetical protein
VTYGFWIDAPVTIKSQCRKFPWRIACLGYSLKNYFGELYNCYSFWCVNRMTVVWLVSVCHVFACSLLKFSQLPVLGLLHTCNFGAFLILWYKELISRQVECFTQ